MDATNVNPVNKAFLYDFFIQIAKFCFSHTFSKTQIESFCSIVQQVIAEDINIWQRGPRASFDHLKKLILQLSVDHPPYGIPLYTPLQSTLGIDFVLKLYYNHYYLYKYTLSKVPEPELIQSNVAGIEEPLQTPDLNDALLIGTIGTTKQ